MTLNSFHVSRLPYGELRLILSSYSFDVSGKTFFLFSSLILFWTLLAKFLASTNWFFFFLVELLFFLFLVFLVCKLVAL